MDEPAFDSVWYKEWAASVKLRPAMYIGRMNAKGACGLLKNILAHYIWLSHGKELFFTVSLEGGKRYKVTIKGLEAEQVLRKNWESGLYILCAASSEALINIKHGGSYSTLIFKGGDFISNIILEHEAEPEVELQFELNETYFKTRPDFANLSELCQELAILDKRTRFLVKDDAQPYPNQVFYHFPGGLKYLLEQQCEKAPNSTLDCILIDEFFKGVYYQVGIAFQPGPYLGILPVSYAGYGRTIDGGSLVEGILQGMLDVRRKYRAANSCTEGHKYSKYHFKGRLVVVCQVITEDDGYNYYSGLRDKLTMPTIQKEARRLVRERMNAVLEGNPALGAQAFGGN
jgi:DNA gyrase/topoisomerase IV subunit B